MTYMYFFDVLLTLSFFCLPLPGSEERPCLGKRQLGCRSDDDEHQGSLAGLLGSENF